MRRWQVIRGEVLWRKQLFKVGDLMPETFTDADRNTHIFGRRLAPVEMPDEPVPSPTEAEAVPPTEAIPSPTKPAVKAAAPKPVTKA